MLYGNHLISNLVSRINYGIKKRLRFIKLDLNDTTLKILKILYENGMIRAYRIEGNNILLYFKYYLCNSILNLKLISRPGNRARWTINKLMLNYNNNNFIGFYIISTNKGLMTSYSCLIRDISCGEILIKVSLY